MKKNLINLLVITCILTVTTTSSVFADVIQTSGIQKQQQTNLYAQQVEYLRQQTEYLRQQTEALKQQNEALRQNQAYNQGYIEGQRVPTREVYVHETYTPEVFVGGLCAGYVLGHWAGYRPCYRPYCRHCW